MPTSITRHRHSSFIAQSGRCYYCGFPLWESNKNSFAKTHNIPTKAAHLLQCTAEHLVARQDGGKNQKQNIVAACLACNKRRHSRKRAQNPDSYRTLVQNRVKRGKWHPEALSGMVDR